MRRSFPLATLVLLVSLPAAAAAQREQLQPGPESETVSVSISGKVGGKTVQGSGAGSCRHAPDASIRGASASLWIVQFSGEDDGLKQLSLTLWRLKDGGSDQLSLEVETKSRTHRVETGSGKNQGEATVVILPHGPGGRFEIKGKDSKGKAMQIGIDCPAFAGVEAEGG
jgi:hypothetical protein